MSPGAGPGRWQRIVIEAPPTGQDTFGAPTGDWEIVAHRDALIEPLMGREFLEARQHAAAVTHRIVMRHSATMTITPAMRIVYRNRHFDIEAVVVPGERRQWLHVMARERM